eukprot:gene10803-33481_t
MQLAKKQWVSEGWDILLYDYSGPSVPDYPLSDYLARWCHWCHGRWGGDDHTMVQ